MLIPWKESYHQPRQHIKIRDITLLKKVRLVTVQVFPVIMYGCESWTIRKADHWRILWFWTLVLEKTLESALDSKKIKPVNPKWNQSWIFTGRTDWCWNWRSDTLATWWEELAHCKIQWCWEQLKAEGQGDDRGWDTCMALPTQWTWV